MGRPARWKLTATSPWPLLMSLVWFLARWHLRGRSAPPRQCVLSAIGGPSAGSDRIDRTPATDPDGRPTLARNQRFGIREAGRRVAPASGRTSSTSSRSASKALHRTVSAQRIDHHHSRQPEPSFFTPQGSEMRRIESHALVGCLVCGIPCRDSELDVYGRWCVDRDGCSRRWLERRKSSPHRLAFRPPPEPTFGSCLPTAGPEGFSRG